MGQPNLPSLVTAAKSEKEAQVAQKAAARAEPGGEGADYPAGALKEF